VHTADEKEVSADGGARANGKRNGGNECRKCNARRGGRLSQRAKMSRANLFPACKRKESERRPFFFLCGGDAVGFATSPCQSCSTSIHFNFCCLRRPICPLSQMPSLEVDGSLPSALSIPWLKLLLELMFSDLVMRRRRLFAWGTCASHFQLETVLREI
jgi:hypothetical protein